VARLPEAEQYTEELVLLVLADVVADHCGCVPFLCFAAERN
jgi:hypothetical protein